MTYSHRQLRRKEKEEPGTHRSAKGTLFHLLCLLLHLPPARPNVGWQNLVKESRDKLMRTESLDGGLTPHLPHMKDRNEQLSLLPTLPKHLCY
ncbi:hypothetical protein LEMLEM_LOCUS6969 [Lemmus lemmus]